MATLTSYETREFFTFIYIPLIPLSKYRIFDECGSCRRHYRLSHAEFESALNAKVEPLREAVRKTPQDPAAHEQLVAELLGLSMSSEAETAARAAVDVLPNDAKLNLLAGQVLAQKGDLEGAAAFMGRAVYFDPADTAARLSLGRIEYLRGKYAEAVPHLEEARRGSTGDTANKAAFLLGECLIALQRWQDALMLWQSLAASSSDREILRRIGICKKNLGYELHPAEKKATRRWWPFGKSTPPRVELARPAGAPRLVRVALGIIAVFAVVGGGAMAIGIYQSRNVSVHFDSIDPKATFVVDGKERFEAMTGPVERTLSPGKHEVVVLDAKGRVIEKRTIDIEAKEFFDALSSEREYVYNTGAMRVYRQATLHYAANAEESSVEESLIGGEGFFAVEDMDYMFSDPPQQLSASSSSTRVRKRALLVQGDLTPLTYGMIRMGEGKTGEARKVFAMLVEKDPCDSHPRDLLATALMFEQKNDEAVKIAREGVRKCGKLEHHRDYQSLLQVVGRREEATAEYRAALAANPRSAMHHYLYGRVLKNPAEAMKEQREAIRLDPNLGWAHAALGHELLTHGGYADAMESFGAALKTKQHDERAPLYYVYAAIAAGRPAEARALVPEKPKQRFVSFYDWQTNWLLSLGARQWTAADAMLKEHSQSSDPTFWSAGAQLYRLRGDETAYLQHLGQGKARAELAEAVTLAELEDLYIAGRWKDAIAMTDASSRKLGNHARRMAMYAAAAAMLDGDLAGARERAAAVRASLAEKDVAAWERTAVQELLSALDGGVPEEQALASLRDIGADQLKDGYFFLAARAAGAGNAAHAKELFRKSAETSFDLGFPLLAARRLGNA